jgi:hypothetical protein
MPSRKSKHNRLSSPAEEIRRQSPVKIGPKFFQLLVFPRENWPCEESSIGCIHYLENEIHVKEDLKNPCDMIDTLFHECVHGVVTLFLQSNREGSGRGKNEEHYVSACEVGLTTLFLDNPGLLALFVKYWTAKNRQPPKGDPK